MRVGNPATIIKAIDVIIFFKRQKSPEAPYNK